MTDLDWNGSLEIEQPNFDTEFLVLAGPQGPAGTAGAFQNTYRNAWASTTSYLAGDLVKSAGSVWLAKVDNSNVTPAEGATWTKVVDSGTNGINGTNGRGITSIARTSGTGAAGSTDVYTITYTDSTTSTFSVVNGANGINGTNGQGVPVGGTTGQVLRKKSAADYDTEWQTPAASGGGGALLASVRYEPGTAAVATSTSTTPANLDSLNLSVAAVTVPATGKLRVHLGAQANASAASTAYGWSLMTTNTAEVSGTFRVLAPSTTYTRYEVDIIVSLTAGATVNLFWGHRFGGNAATGRTTYGGNVSPYYGAATMEVYAA